jgi:hypothetical protein
MPREVSDFFTHDNTVFTRRQPTINPGDERKRAKRTTLATGIPEFGSKQGAADGEKDWEANADHWGRRGYRIKRFRYKIVMVL